MAEIEEKVILELLREGKLIEENIINDVYRMYLQLKNAGDSAKLLEVFVNRGYLTNEQIQQLFNQNNTKTLQKISDYNIVKKLGSGGMGSVFLVKKDEKPVWTLYHKGAAELVLENCTTYLDIDGSEKELIVLLNQYPGIIKSAADNYSPAELANYIYLLAKKFNAFYTDHSIVNAESEEKKHLRALISSMISQVLKHGLGLLGIEAPERM